MKIRRLLPVIVGIFILSTLGLSPFAFASPTITLDHALFNQNSGKFGAVVSISGYAQDDLDNFEITFGLWNLKLKEGDVDGEDFDEHGNFHQKPSKSNPRSGPFVELQTAKINLNGGKASFKATSFDLTPSQLEDYIIIIGIHNQTVGEGALETFPLNN